MTVKEELREIARMNKGVLKTSDVVDYARDNNTTLHKCFEWDDSLAAEKYRLEQAKLIVRVQMIDVPIDKESRTVKVREYFSLTEKRGDGEYKKLVDIIKTRPYREQLLADARNELRSFQEKYSILEELCEVHTAIRKYIGIK